MHIFRVLKVAKKFQDAGKKVYFGVSNPDPFHHEMSEFGIESPPTSKDKPMVIAKDANDKKYKMEAEFRSVDIKLAILFF